MNWDAISAVAESLSSVAILVTLVYLSVQVRQAREENKRSSQQQLLVADLEQLKEQRDDAHFFFNLATREPLSPEEEYRLTMYLTSFLRIREFAWFQYNAGNMDEAVWNSYKSAILATFNHERTKQILRTLKPAFDAGFIQAVENIIATESLPNDAISLLAGKNSNA